MDILLRDLNPEDIEWIKKKTQNATSQNKFIKSLISEARIKEKLQLVRNSEKKNSYQDSNTPFSFIDLFAGIGGFRSALTFLGGKCVFTNEWNKYAITTYKNWYGDEESTNDDDIRNFNHSLIPNHDVLCAGFPCQPFSLAGVSKKNSLGRKHGFEDADQGNLFDCIMSIVDVKRPPILFLENVKNLKSHDKGNTYKVIENKLQDIGYHIKTSILDTNKITSIPQHRERIYIIGFLDKKIYDKFNFDFPEKEQGKICDMLEKNINDKYYYSDRFKVFEEIEKGVTKHISENVLYQYRRYYVRENKSNSCPTLTANMGGGGHNVPLLKDDKGIRKLTPRECFNLQGFPKNYKLPELCDSELYKLAGNAVSVPVVELIVNKLEKII